MVSQPNPLIKESHSAYKQSTPKSVSFEVSGKNKSTNPLRFRSEGSHAPMLPPGRKRPNFDSFGMHSPLGIVLHHRRNHSPGYIICCWDRYD